MTKLEDYHPRAVGVSWFRKEDYDALRKLFTDGHKMPETWKEWLKGAEQMERDMKSKVDIVERVYIDPTTFGDWCRQNGTTIDRQGRHKFVATMVAKKYAGTH